MNDMTRITLTFLPFLLGLLIGNSFHRKPIAKIIKGYKQKDWEIIQLQVEDKDYTVYKITLKAKNVRHAIEMMLLDAEIKNVLSYKIFEIENNKILADWQKF